MLPHLKNSIPQFPFGRSASWSRRAHRALRHTVLFAAIPLCGMAVSATAQTTAPSKPVVVRMGFTGFTAADWPDMVAIQKGFLKRRAIDLQILKSQKATINIQSLIGGSLNFVASGMDSVILPVENGADLVSVAGVQNLLVMRLMANPAIKSIKDLKGKKLAVSRTNGPDAGLLRDFMASAGLKINPGQFVVSGGSASRIAAVINGGASATMVIPPDGLRVTKDGLTDFGLNVGRTPPRQFVVWITNRTWARQNSGTVVKMLQGLVDSLRWLNDPANQQEAIQILMSYTNVNVDLAQRAYEVLVSETHSYSKEGELNTAGIENVLKDLVNAGVIKRPIPSANKYIDMSYLQIALKQ
jgi:NitT/TauT family transport system substrate-binding protein